MDERSRFSNANPDFPQATFLSSQDLEAAAASSPPHVVIFKAPLTATGKGMIRFPVHHRYQAPSDGSAYGNATMLPPRLFLECRGGGSSPKGEPTRSMQGMCLPSRMRAGEPPLSLAPPLRMEVPLGLLSHVWVVTAGTLGATVGGALAVIAALYRQ